MNLEFEHNIEYLLAIISAILGMSLPIMLQVIERIDQKYKSSRLAERLKREPAIRFCKWSLVIALVACSYTVFFRIDSLVDCWIINNSANLIDKYTNDMDKVFIIDQEEKEGSIFYINYFSNKVSTNLLNYELNTKIDNAYEYFYINYYDYLFKFDYLYTYSINNILINKYSFLSSDKIEEHTLYKIIKNNDKISLKKIDSLK